MEQPFFVSDIAFEGPGSKFTLKLRKGEKVYEFSTNYIENYPLITTTRTADETLTAKERLERIVRKRTDAKFSVDFVDYNLLELQIDRDEFKKLDEQFPDWLKGRFQQKYKPKARWEIGVHRKVDVSPDLESLLERNRSANQKIDAMNWLLRDSHSSSMNDEYEFWHAQVSGEVDKQDFDSITTHLNELVPERKLSKDIRNYLFEELDRILQGYDSLELSTRNIKNFKYVVANIFAKAIHFKYEKQITSELKALLKGKEKKTYDQNILLLRDSLLEEVSNVNTMIKSKNESNNFFLDTERMKTYLYLNIMSRDKNKKIKIKGLDFKTDNYQKQTLTLEEINSLPSGCLDIEKFQFGSIFELISHAGLKLLSDNSGDITRLVDTIRHNKEPYVDDYLIRTKKWEHEAIINTAKTINEKNPFLMHFFNANYDLRHYKESMDFLLGIDEKPPRKEATVAKQEDGSDFMGRYGLANQQVVDWYKFMNIYAPHMLQRRLGTFLNYVWKKMDVDKSWEKSIDYDEGRENDIISTDIDSDNPAKREEAYSRSRENLFYTKEDVEYLEEIVRTTYGQAMLKDMLDIRDTFNITLTQITSLATTVRNYLEQKFYEKNKNFLDVDFFREEKRKKVTRFKANYTNLKLKTFKRRGLEVYSDNKVHDEIYQYYFSPEMNIALSMTNQFEEIKRFIEDTKNISDHERQVGRLQYVRVFFIPMMTEYTDLRKKKEFIIQELNTNEHISQHAEHPFNNLLSELKEQAGTNVELEMSVFNEQLRMFFKQFQELKIDPSNSKTKKVLNMLRSYKNSSWFFSKVWGSKASDIETYLDNTFKKAVDIMNNNGAQPIYLTGKFVFCKNELSDKEAVQSGLFKLQKLPIYTYGKDGIAYFSEGKYNNCPNRKIATDDFTLFEIEFMNKLMDSIFQKDYKSVLETIGLAARKINQMERSLADDTFENKDFVKSLLYHVRSRNVYKTYELSNDEIIPVEFGEDSKHSFKPDNNYYKGVFFGNVFGAYNFENIPEELSEKKKYKALSLTSRVSELITGFYPLKDVKRIRNDEDLEQLSMFKTYSNEPTQLYIELVCSQTEKEQKEIINRMMKYVKIS